MVAPSSQELEPPTIPARFNLSLTYATADQKFSLSAFVRNLEDDLQLRGAPQGINPAGVGTRDRTFVRISEPRTYGLRMGIRY